MRLLFLLSLLSLTRGFSPAQPQRAKSAVSASASDDNYDDTPSISKPTASTASNDNARRKVLSAITGAFALAVVPAIAQAGLLDDFGSDPGKIENKVAEPAVKAAGTPKAAIDPTLKGSYYYPTAKKRYLPRIQKVTEQITAMPDAIAAENWEAIAEFGKTADNAVLPLQLYVSSLDGQGLSMTNSYAKAMKEDALQYEKAYKLFEKALKKQNQDQLLAAVIDMGVCIADYRQTGRLSDDAGNIPSVDEMRRLAMRRPVVKSQWQ